MLAKRLPALYEAPPYWHIPPFVWAFTLKPKTNNDASKSFHSIFVCEVRGGDCLVPRMIRCVVFRYVTQKKKRTTYENKMQATVCFILKNLLSLIFCLHKFNKNHVKKKIPGFGELER